MEKARYCYDCIHKDVCRFTEDAARVEAEIKKSRDETPIRMTCQRKHEDTL